MFKMLRRLTITTLLITAILALSPVAWAANEPSKTDTSIAALGATVTITNNYAATDYLEIALDAKATVNTAFWVFYPDGPLDKSGQVGTVTVKKGATTGKLTISAGKLTDLNAGSLVVKPANGTDTYVCDYDEAAATTIANVEDYVTLRNSPTGAEYLIVDGSIVEKGMIAYAVVNGKMYKATAAKPGVQLQVSLPANLEQGTPVWYSLAYAGCKDIGYIEYVNGDGTVGLGAVETTATPVTAEMILFFQGDASPSSSLMVKNVNPGDTIRCTFENTSGNGSTVIVKKSATVPAGSTIVTVTGMKLATGDILSITRTEKGKLESAAVTITVPGDVASKKPASTAVVTKRTTDTSALVDITVKNVTVGDRVTIYDDKGVELDSDDAVAPAPSDPAEEPATKANVEFTSINVGTAATSIYVAVTSPGMDESPWLKITIKAAKIEITPAPTPPPPPLPPSPGDDGGGGGDPEP